MIILRGLLITEYLERDKHTKYNNNLERAGFYKGVSAMSEKVEVLENWFKRVWGGGDAGAIDELFVPDPEIREIGMQKPIELEEFKELHKLICKQLKDIDIRINMTVEEGDWLSALCTCYAKSTRTDESVTVTGTVTVKIKDGKLRGGFQHWDFMHLWDQLGLLPGESFRKCLNGEKLA